MHQLRVQGKTEEASFYEGLQQVIDQLPIDPFITSLSDHDGQIIKLGNISMQKQLHETRTIRIFNKCTIHDFMTKLRYETWGNIFDGNDVDSIFNNFPNTF